jgi:radical SAM protein with 4Fe4S-binding SPASM domain
MEYYPRTIDWELTSSQARNSGPDLENSEPGRDQALDIAVQLKSLFTENVNLLGDDTLRYPHWFELATALTRSGIRTEIVTYKPIPANESASRVRDSGVSRVVFGLDGLAVNHDLIHRQPDLFKNLVRDIDKILSVGLPVGVTTMVSDKNIGELPTMLYVLHAAGVSNWKLQALIATSPWHFPNGTKLSEYTYSRLQSFLCLIAPQAEKLEIVLELDDSIGYFGVNDNRAAPWDGCPGGRSACAITCAGTVKGCLLLPDSMIEGELRQRTLTDIWFDLQSFAYNRNPDDLVNGPNCECCEHGGHCRGGCSAMSYALTGRLHNNPFCFYGMGRREP